MKTQLKQQVFFFGYDVPLTSGAFSRGTKDVQMPYLCWRSRQKLDACRAPTCCGSIAVKQQWVSHFLFLETSFFFSSYMNQTQMLITLIESCAETDWLIWISAGRSRKIPPVRTNPQGLCWQRMLGGTGVWFKTILTDLTSSFQNRQPCDVFLYQPATLFFPPQTLPF